MRHGNVPSTLAPAIRACKAGSPVVRRSSQVKANGAAPSVEDFRLGYPASEQIAEIQGSRRSGGRRVDTSAVNRDDLIGLILGRRCYPR